MNFDLSLSKFWENHGNIFQNKKKIISIANHTGLPKETARRKIIQLIKKKHIKKLDKNKILWEPDPHFKDTYISIIEEQINSLSKFIYQVTKVIGFNSPISRIQKELKDNYSFRKNVSLNNLNFSFSHNDNSSTTRKKRFIITAVYHGTRTENFDFMAVSVFFTSLNSNDRFICSMFLICSYLMLIYMYISFHNNINFLLCLAKTDITCFPGKCYS